MDKYERIQKKWKTFLLQENPDKEVFSTSCIFVQIIVYRMEFDKTKWSCPWNSDRGWHKILPGMVVVGVGGSRG